MLDMKNGLKAVGIIPSGVVTSFRADDVLFLRHDKRKQEVRVGFKNSNTHLDFSGVLLEQADQLHQLVFGKSAIPPRSSLIEGALWDNVWSENDRVGEHMRHIIDTPNNEGGWIEECVNDISWHTLYAHGDANTVDEAKQAVEQALLERREIKAKECRKGAEHGQ